MEYIKARFTHNPRLFVISCTGDIVSPAKIKKTLKLSKSGISFSPDDYGMG